jgi:uncharacterized membrane protein (TIGR02234 family)
MTSDGPAQRLPARGGPGRVPRRPGPRGEYWLVLLLGAAGAGLVLLATRQAWAHIRTIAPKPLPASVVSVTGQSLVPAAAALAIAALASLAAVLATRRTARRVAGLLLAAFGAGIAASVSAGISAADVLAAGAGNAAAAAGTGTGASSVTSGAPASGGISAGTSPIAGLPGHVVLALLPWRGLAIAGALIIVAAGLLVAWRGTRWPVMSSQYDLPARPARTASCGPPVTAARRPPPGADMATVWESLSRGDDPTA